VKNSWLFPFLQGIHSISMAVLVGSIALRDFAQLGWANPDLRSSTRWTVAGLVAVLTTGLVLFFADAARYRKNPAFAWKTGLLAAALLAHFTVHRRADRSTAALSLLLWSAVVLAARAIADFDI
jgi:uncharacterized membrane protein